MSCRIMGKFSAATLHEELEADATQEEEPS